MEHLSEEELVMRSFIDGVELLVFTSKVLHEDSCSEFSSPSLAAATLFYYKCDETFYTVVFSTSKDMRKNCYI